MVVHCQSTQIKSGNDLGGSVDVSILFRRNDFAY